MTILTDNGLSEENRALVERECGPVWKALVAEEGHLDALLNAARSQGRSEESVSQSASPPLHRDNEPECERMMADEEGWSEWIHPLPDYRMKCCDCGLVHVMEFEIGRFGPDHDTSPERLNPGEDADHAVVFRARRWTPEDGLQAPAREGERSEVRATPIPLQDEPS